MRKHIFVLSLLLIFTFPAFAHAAVVINEIAWMGTAANSSAEWIELANSGSDSVDLSGWKLTSSTWSSAITLTGTISGNGYYLLEHNTTGAKIDVAPDQSPYTGTLPNTGATLTLTDENKVQVDQVIGGTNWINIGGNTTNYDTAQRTASGAWITAAPTPGKMNALVADIVPDAAGDDESSSATTTDNSTTDEAGGSSNGTSVWAPAPAALVVDTGPDRTALVEVPCIFTASVKTKNGAVDPSARVDWSFGDGSATEGTTVEKTYRYAGTYLAVAVATDGSATARDDLVVTVNPAAARIAAVSGDGITLANDADERLDLSGWRLVTGAGSFRIPEGTTLLPNASSLFPNAVTDLPVTLTASLEYPDGIIATQYAPLIHQANAAILAPNLQPSASSTSSNTIPAVDPISSTKSNIPKNDEAINAPAAATELAAAGAALSSVSPTSSEDVEATGTPATGLFHSPWLFGLVGVIAAAGGAFIIL